MKYIALEELQKHIIHDECDKRCGYIDERDIAAIPTVDLDKIRAEIADIYCGQYCENPFKAAAVREMALDIIDKYMAEGSEE